MCTVLVVVLATCVALLPAPGARAATIGLPTYRHLGLVPQDGAGLLNSGSTTSRIDTGVHDAYGVRMDLRSGRLYDNPVGQAAYGLVNLTTYSATHDKFYLNRALAQANRLVARRVVSGDAWFFPYPFTFPLHGGTDVERPPWYSGMAQGLTLALFSRLSTVTGSAAWRTYAGYAFRSFSHGPSTSAPWVSRVDASGYLWLEEYPLLPATRSDRTYNGFMFALMGVYEYWHLTRSTTAAALFDGGATTVRQTFTAFRNARWISRYCLAHPTVLSDDYHWSHEAQLLSMYSATHDSTFAKDSDLLRYDYPRPASGTVRFSAGTHVGYRYSASGAVIAGRTLRLSSVSQASASDRRRIYGRGINYLMSTGALAGYWVSEYPPARTLHALAVVHVYVPARSARLAAGSYLGYRLGSGGQTLGTVRASFTTTTTVAVPRTGYLNGYEFAMISSGALAGTWVAMTSSVSLR